MKSYAVTYNIQTRPIDFNWNMNCLIGLTWITKSEENKLEILQWNIRVAEKQK